LLKIKKLLPNNFFDCYNLIKTNKNDSIYFKQLGWSGDQFKNQLIKDNNFSLALFNDDLMLSFVIGDIISIEKIIEYEILLVYVNFNYRLLGYASKLLNEIPSVLKHRNLEKIYLEVSSDNVDAIELYKNNNFVQIGIRKNYYYIAKKKSDALLFEKKINE
jgi:ribosomal-protein-alanine N-acetyltransferase